MCRSPINPVDSYLFVCLTLRDATCFLSFHLPPLTAVCVCVCQSFGPIIFMLSDTDSGLHSGAGELWAVINLKCYLRDTWDALWQQQHLFSVVPLCNGRGGTVQVVIPIPCHLTKKHLCSVVDLKCIIEIGEHLLNERFKSILKLIKVVSPTQHLSFEWVSNSQFLQVWKFVASAPLKWITIMSSFHMGEVIYRKVQITQNLPAARRYLPRCPQHVLSNHCPVALQG